MVLDGSRQNMLGILSVDGRPLRFMGQVYKKDGDTFEDICEKEFWNITKSVSVFEWSRKSF